MNGLGRRVAITGYGVVAPCGLGKDAFWSGLLGPGLSGVDRSTVIDGWDSSAYYASPKEARRADVSEQFAIAAATEAMEQAGDLGLDPARFGTIFATGVGGIHTLEEQITVRIDKGVRRVSPFLVPMMMANAPGAAISMRFGLQGPNETIVTACAAGTHALVYAARVISWGLADAVISGGTEHAGTITALAGFGNMTALSSSGTSRPFDTDRDGFIMGEGAAAFVLEEWDHAVARGAHIVGEIIGGGSNADAHHITAPAPGGVGAIACMRLALDDAGLTPGRHQADQRPRHEHAAQRRRRGRGGVGGLRRRQGPGGVHQGRDRSCARRRRRARGCGGAAVVRTSPDPADGQHQGARATTSRSTSSWARHVTGSRDRRCRTTSASADTTAPSSSLRPEALRTRSCGPPFGPTDPTCVE